MGLNFFGSLHVLAVIMRIKLHTLNNRTIYDYPSLFPIISFSPCFFMYFYDECSWKNLIFYKLIPCRGLTIRTIYRCWSFSYQKLNGLYSLLSLTYLIFSYFTTNLELVCVLLCKANPIVILKGCIWPLADLHVLNHIAYKFQHKTSL